MAIEFRGDGCLDISSERQAGTWWASGIDTRRGRAVAPDLCVDHGAAALVQYRLLVELVKQLAAAGGAWCVSEGGSPLGAVEHGLCDHDLLATIAHRGVRAGASFDEERDAGRVEMMLCPRPVAHNLWRARAIRLDGDPAGAAVMLASLIEDAPDLAIARAELAHALLACDLWQDARDAATYALAARPCARAHLLRARALVRLGEHDDAWGDLAAAQRLSPRHPALLLAQAEALLALDDIQGAWDVIQAVLGADPGHLEARLERARIALAAGDRAAAREDLDLCLAARPTWKAAIRLLSATARSA